MMLKQSMYLGKENRQPNQMKENKPEQTALAKDRYQMAMEMCWGCGILPGGYGIWFFY